MTQLTIGTAMMQHPSFERNEVLPDTIEPRLDEASALIAEAARRGCDILCLPELFADPTQGTRMADFAETLGGPVTTWLAGKARAHDMALVATVTLRHERGITNTGVAYSKQGELVGQYGKVHLPPGERDVSVPGEEFTVFELEGATIGMQTCYDLNFPEGCRILALKGAEIIIWPNMWGGMPEGHTDILMRARAIENHVFFVSAAFVLPGDGSFLVRKLHGRSCILDWSGSVLAEVGRRLGVAVATIDLDEVRGGKPEVKHLLLRHRLPHLYAEISAGE